MCFILQELLAIPEITAIPLPCFFLSFYFSHLSMLHICHCSLVSLACCEGVWKPWHYHSETSEPIRG